MIDYTLPLDQLPDPLPIEPLRKPFDVTITPPGSKSITCRAYVLAALAKGESKIIRPLRADDTDHLLNALCTLGAEARWVKGENHDGEDVYIKGVNGRFPRGGNLYMGEGGTPTRFMIACACLAKEPVTIDASPRMRERPISEGVDLLRQLGAKIEYAEAEGRLPVRVELASNLQGGRLEIGETSSSQHVSAILLISSYLPKGVEVNYSHAITSESYIGLTLGVLAEWGANYEAEHKWLLKKVRHSVHPVEIGAREYRVSPDMSADIYWLSAAAISPESRAGLHDNAYADQPDTLCLKALQDAGFEHSDCYADFFGLGPRTLRAFNFDARNAPDGALALAAVASKCEGTSRITGLRTLRVKETDRIAALANELRKVGCTVETGEDWIAITPPAALVARRSVSCEPVPGDPTDRKDKNSSHDAERRATSRPIIIETYNDHRMAMAFAVLGLNPPNGIPLAICNPKCVAKSYPGFWKDFAKLYR